MGRYITLILILCGMCIHMACADETTMHRQSVVDLLEQGKTDQRAYLQLLQYVCGSQLDSNTTDALNPK
jgi:hypothetical protein